MNTPAKTLFDSILRNSIGLGLDPYFFGEEHSYTSSKFPPYTISQAVENTQPDHSVDRYRLTMAIAGYTEADIEITIHNDILGISGKKATTSTPETHQVLYGGIGLREFTREFKLGDNIYVENASLKDGLLQVDLAREQPKANQPKRIAISADR